MSKTLIPANPVLIVDDDEDLQRSFAFSLRSHGINNIMQCTDSREVLDLLSQHAIDIILLDLNMPIMNGIEFLEAIKADAELKCIPVVVLTTSDEQKDKLESFKLGVAGYMRKPVDYQQFVEVIRTINAYWTISESPV